MRPTPLVLLLATCAPAAPASIDITAPSVSSVTPPDGATGVPPSVTPQICFDRPMDPATLTPTTTILGRKVGATAHAMVTTVVAAGDDRCATIEPLGPLAPSSAYRIEVTTGAHSASGVAMAHPKSQRAAFAAGFTTAGPPSVATLWIPANGTIAAPLDLAWVVVDFSRPVTSGQAPLLLSPPAGPSALSPDGTAAQVPAPTPLSPGESFAVTLSPSLRDPDGRPPQAPGALGFTIGSCAEGSPPSVSDGTPLPRDRDALLLFQVDRPSICSARVSEAGCDGGTAIPAPAACQAPYDPCAGGLLCTCSVPLVGLCPGGDVLATPEATGWNGQVGTATDASTFQLSNPLPPIVLDELLLSPEGTRSAGEFLELANLGSEPVDLLGIVLANCKGTEACANPTATQPFGAASPGGSTVIPAHGYALLVDPRFDPAEAPAMPPDTLLLAPLDGTPLLSLSDSRPQPIGLFAAGGAGPPLSTYDGSLVAQKGVSFERIDPGAPDPLPDAWASSSVLGGTPGACNSVTPAAQCPDARP